MMRYMKARLLQELLRLRRGVVAWSENMSVYHGNYDIFKLADYIRSLDATYHFYMRYYGINLYPSEIVLYAV